MSEPGEIIRRAASVIPSPRQLALQQMEFYGFVHFGLYTFAPNREGNQGPEAFTPRVLDAD